MGGFEHITATLWALGSCTVWFLWLLMPSWVCMGMQHEEMKCTATGLPGRGCAADGMTCQAPPHQVIHLAGHKKAYCWNTNLTRFHIPSVGTDHRV
jgi:hypothetical protein